MQHLCQRLGLVKDSDPVSLSKTQIWDLCQRLRCGIFAKESNIVSLPKETHIWCLCQRIRFRWLGILAKESQPFLPGGPRLWHPSALVSGGLNIAATQSGGGSKCMSNSRNDKRRIPSRSASFSQTEQRKSFLRTVILWVWRLLCHVDSKFELH